MLRTILELHKKYDYSTYIIFFVIPPSTIIFAPFTKSFSLLVKNKQALTISRGIFSVISILLILIALLPINLFLRIGAGVLSLPFIYIFH